MANVKVEIEEETQCADSICETYWSNDKETNDVPEIFTTVKKEQSTNPEPKKEPKRNKPVRYQKKFQTILDFTSEGPSQCDRCGRKSSSLRSLDLHLLLGHKETDTTCKLCDKTFIHKRSLKFHVKSSHTLGHSETPDFTCHHCFKSFTTKTCLNDHLKNHRDANQEVCYNCDSCKC